MATITNIELLKIEPIIKKPVVTKHILFAVIAFIGINSSTYNTSIAIQHL